MACFWAADHKPALTITVDFEWKSGIAAKDWGKVAKKGQVEVYNSFLYCILIIDFSEFKLCMFSV